jgi:hypothetical protein
MIRKLRVPGLFFFSVFLTAAVLSCHTVKVAEPMPQPREVVVDWEVTPADGYEDQLGFVRMDFAPPDELREALAARAGPENPNQHEEQPVIPAGGRLTVHLGYRNLLDANTVWYSFEITEGSRIRLRLDGEEGIPNVKGPDGYWWNDVDLDLLQPVTGGIRVVVSDKRSRAAYTFSLRRLERNE